MHTKTRHATPGSPAHYVLQAHEPYGSYVCMCEQRFGKVVYSSFPGIRSPCNSKCQQLLLSELRHLWFKGPIYSMLNKGVYAISTCKAQQTMLSVCMHPLSSARFSMLCSRLAQGNTTSSLFDTGVRVSRIR
eukprot:446835-Pelagomonas_calceolata.AAC.3